jgi:hypothetical protein
MTRTPPLLLTAGSPQARDDIRFVLSCLPEESEGRYHFPPGRPYRPGGGIDGILAGVEVHDE